MKDSQALRALEAVLLAIWLPAMTLVGVRASPAQALTLHFYKSSFETSTSAPHPAWWCMLTLFKTTCISPAT